MFFRSRKKEASTKEDAQKLQDFTLPQQTQEVPKANICRTDVYKIYAQKSKEWSKLK